MKAFYYYFLLILFQTFSFGQNLVPNGSFENYKKCPTDISQFSNVMNWMSPCIHATPDLHSLCVNNNSQANPKHLYYQIKPIEGIACAGVITLCKNKKSDYREYIGVKLYSKLFKDSTYIFRIALAIPAKCPMLNHNFDILFQKYIFSSYSNQAIIKNASIEVKIDTIKTDGSWTTFELEYVADGTEKYLYLGNFNSKKNSNWNYIENRKKITPKGEFYSIILIDDVQLIQKHPKVVELPVVKEKLPKLIENKTFVFSDLKFKTNSSELILTNLHKLDSLADYLVQNDQFSIVVKGHTDNQGNYEKNKVLSLDRANSVADYLIYKGVSSHRISTVGYGSSMPIQENDSEEGRLANRRVEIALE